MYCTPVPTRIGVNLLGLMAAGGVSYLLDRIHPEEIKKIVKKTSRYFRGVPFCTAFQFRTSHGHVGADSLRACTTGRGYGSFRGGQLLPPPSWNGSSAVPNSTK